MLVILLLCPDPPSTLVPCSVSPEPEHMTELSELILVFLLSPIVLALMKGAVGRRGFPIIENRPVSYPLAQTVALFLHVIHVFGFLSAGIVLTSSLVLPQVNIFKGYLTLAHFPSGWQPVLFQPGTRFRKECHSHTFQGATWKWVSIYCSVHCGGSSVCV